MSSPLQVTDLGRVGYADAFRLQKELVERVFAARESGGPMHLLLLEHSPPVITVSRRPQAAANVIASAERLSQLGIELAETDRGGDVTYHGPGQVVAYPILDLQRLGLRIHSYMRELEEVVISLCARQGLAAFRDPTATGVWVGEPPARTRKICAMGVRVSRWVSMHGLALNVCPDLTHFGCIVPCGLVGRPVTSLQAELATASPTVEEVKSELAKLFGEMVESRLNIG